MKIKEDLTGRKFGKLVVTGFSHRDSRSRTFWNTVCECGREKPCKADLLKSGRQVSCGQKGCKSGRPRTGRWIGYKDQEKNRRLRKTYGIGLDDYERMYAEQKGCCAICETPYSLLYVDHSHETGKVRKLLCPQCNSLLGYCRENVNTLISAIRYLRG